MALSFPGSGLVTRPGQWRPGDRTEDVGTVIVAGCKTPTVLHQGKERLDFVTLAIQPLAVMDWFLAAATGRDARRDAPPGQHLADFVPPVPLIPHHRSSRRHILQHPISASEVPALPLTQVEPSGTTFAVADPMELAGHAPPWRYQSGGPLC